MRANEIRGLSGWTLRSAHLAWSSYASAAVDTTDSPVPRRKGCQEEKVAPGARRRASNVSALCLFLSARIRRMPGEEKNMTDNRRPAPVGEPIHEILSYRWSPRAFAPRAVEPEK